MGGGAGGMPQMPPGMDMESLMKNLPPGMDMNKLMQQMGGGNG